MSGYKIACREACKYIEENLCMKVSDLGKDCLINCAKTSMSSKIIGSENVFYSKMVVDAISYVKQGDKYPVKAVNIVKNHGGNSMESELYKGYVLKMMRAS
jgi:T-complex protein 1 subunit alpha